MQPGKIASVILVLVVTTVATGVRVLTSWLWELESSSPALQLSLFAMVVAAVCALVLIPIGCVIDRSVAKLRRYIDGTGTEQSGLGIGGAPASPLGRARWLRPITRAFTGAVDRFRQREQALRNQLGELEIRHRVSEAERRQIEAVLHALRDAVLVTDSFNEIVMANQAAANIFGFDLKKALHKSIDEVIADPHLRQLIRETRDTANFTDSRHVELEVGGSPALGSAAVRPPSSPSSESRTISSRTSLFDVTLTCVENHKREVGAVVTILHDLSREREVSQMKSDFVSKASHELRTPLSSIRAYVEMLIDGEFADGDGSPALRGGTSLPDIYRIIQDETDRLGRLIDNMLNISRIEAGIVQIERESVDIKLLIDRAVSTLEPSARDRKIALHSRPAAVDLRVEGDGDMIYQVVLNLLSNAVKYTPEGGRVTIAADSDNLTRCVLVSISDTGLGIPPDSMPKLFDKFYRVENYKHMAKGTGLGLSLCKHIVETVHRGQIGVESKLGMGSKFWFSIPMRYVGGAGGLASGAREGARLSEPAPPMLTARSVGLPPAA